MESTSRSIVKVLKTLALDFGTALAPIQTSNRQDLSWIAQTSAPLTTSSLHDDCSLEAWGEVVKAERAIRRRENR